MRKTTTFLMFVGDQCGKAEEAVRSYVSLFDDSKVDSIDRWGADEPGGGPEGSVKLAYFTLAGQTYMASENSAPHPFGFTPSISIFVDCEDEDEIDSLFATLSEGGQQLMELGDYGIGKKFGWTADRYGVSWQLRLPD